MTRFQSTFCRSAPWRVVAGRVVLPWSLQGYEPRGDVLEIGAGSGAMAAELLAAHPSITMTVTDVDPEMVDTATRRLGSGATVRQADATALPFDDDSFDGVLSWVMLHHTVEWEKALAEAVRVLRPGGHLVGYDLLSTAPMRLLHRNDQEHIRTMTLDELRASTQELPVDTAILTPSLAGVCVRFLLRKRSVPTSVKPQHRHPDVSLHRRRGVDDVQCRPAGVDDLPFLATMLGEAAVWRPDKPTPTGDEVMADPRYAMYLTGWPRQGDYGLVAEGDEPVGAAWYRTYTEASHGYGFVAEDVPELSIAVIASRRQQGIGRRLLVDLIDASLAQGHAALSLSVSESNPARGLYESVGFVPVEEHGGSWTMVRQARRSS